MSDVYTYTYSPTCKYTHTHTNTDAHIYKCLCLYIDILPYRHTPYDSHFNERAFLGFSNQYFVPLSPRSLKRYYFLDNFKENVSRDFMNSNVVFRFPFFHFSSSLLFSFLFPHWSD